MRPKKRILLIDSEQNSLGIRRFQMQTWGFSVFAASTAAEARDLGATCCPDLVVGVWPFSGADLGTLLQELKEQCPYTPSLLLAARSATIPEDIIVNAALLKSQCSPTEIRERLRRMTPHKPGPRKALPSDTVLRIA